MDDRLYRLAIAVLTGDICATPERLRLKLEGQGRAVNADTCDTLLHVMAAEKRVSVEVDQTGKRIVFRRNGHSSKN